MAGVFGETPSGHELYQAAAARFAARQAARPAAPPDMGAASATAQEPSAAALSDDVLVPYRKPGVQVDVWGPDGKVAVATDTVDRLLEAARRGVMADHQVSVLDRGGQRVGVRLADLPKAMAEGMRPETRQQAVTRRFLAEHKGIKGDAEVALTSFANEILLGLPDLLASKTDPEGMAKIEALRAEHRAADVLGTGAGFAGSMVTGAPVFKAAATVGRAAERATAKVLASRLARAGVEDGAERVGAALAKSVVRMGAEGAVLAAPHAVTEAALGDPDHAAETLMLAFGAGAALGTVSPVARGIYRRLRRSLPQTPAEAIERVLTATPYREAAKRATVVAADGSPRVDVPKLLDEISGEFAWRSAGGRKSLTEGANRYAGGYAEVGKIWRDEAPALVGKKRFREMTVADLAEAASAGKAAHGAEIESSLGVIDAAAKREGRLPKTLDVIGDIERVASELATGHAGTEPVVAKLVAFADSAKRLSGVADLEARLSDALAQAEIAAARGDFKRAAKAGKAAQRLKSELADHRTTYTALHSLRRDVDAVWAGNRANPELVGFKKPFHDVRVALEERLEGAASAAGDLVGRSVLAQYKHAKSRYQAYALLDKATASGLGKEGTNRFASLTDTIAAGAGATVGSVLGGPVGAVVGNVAAFAANHTMRVRGDFMAADALGVASRDARLRRWLQADPARPLLYAEQAIARSARGLDGLAGALARLGTARQPRASAPSAALARLVASRDDGPRRGDRGEQFRRARERLESLAADPARLTAAAGDLASPFGASAPQIAAAYAERQVAALQYLMSTMPREPPRAPFTPPTPWAPPRGELGAWERRVEVVLDPDAVIRHVQRGTLSAEHVDALRAVWPRRAEALVKRIVDDAMRPGAPALSRAARAQLALLTGGGMAPGAGFAVPARLQATYAQETRAAAQPRPGRRVSPPAMRTDAARISG